MFDGAFWGGLAPGEGASLSDADEKRSAPGGRMQPLTMCPRTPISTILTSISRWTSSSCCWAVRCCCWPTQSRRQPSRAMKGPTAGSQDQRELGLPL